MDELIFIRSLLFVPAANTRALAKCAELPAHGVIFDLEDSVLEESRAAAYDNLQALQWSEVASKYPMIRVNHPSHSAFETDAQSVRALGIETVVLPKTNSAQDIENALEKLPNCRFVVMIETSRGVLAAHDILSHSSVVGAILGPNDLAKDLGVKPMPDRLNMLYAQSHLILVASAVQKPVFDGVFNRFDAPQDFAQDCKLGRELGFDGKTLIHPAQIEPCNDIYAPSSSEIDRALKIVAAFEKARQSGRSVANLDGEMIEELHVIQAEAILKHAKINGG